MGRSRWWMLAVMCLGLITVSLDITVLNPDLPAPQRRRGRRYRGTSRQGSRSQCAMMTYVSQAKPDWRQEKKTSTRRRIRAHALRLFREQGYDATTVEQIAAAAGVSHVTFFRYFPTKEDAVLSDDYDPLITALLAQTPAERPITRRIRDALLQGLAEVYETGRDALLAQNQLIAATPALRSRLWADQMAAQQLFLDALGPGTAGQGSPLRARVTVAACLAAATTAVLTWAENNGTPELPELIDQAFDVITQLEQGTQTPPAT